MVSIFGARWCMEINKGKTKRVTNRVFNTHDFPLPLIFRKTSNKCYQSNHLLVSVDFMEV